MWSTESAEETLARALRGPLAPAEAFTGGFVVIRFASDLRDQAGNSRRQ